MVRLVTRGAVHLCRSDANMRGLEVGAALVVTIETKSRQRRHQEADVVAPVRTVTDEAVVPARRVDGCGFRRRGDVFVTR